METIKNILDIYNRISDKIWLIYKKLIIRPINQQPGLKTFYDKYPLYPSHAEQLESLVRTIQAHGNHVIKIFGPDEIGKEVFAVNLYYEMKKISNYRPFIISAENTQDINHWIESIIGGKINEERFFRYLKKHRCFIILKHAEQEAVCSERDKQECSAFDTFIIRINNIKCKSRLVLLYNEKINSIQKINPDNQRIHNLTLERLDINKDGHYFRKTLSKASPSDEYLKEIFDACDGYPLLLENVLKKIKDYSDEELEDMRRSGVFQQFYDKGTESKIAALSQNEKQMLHWLALKSPRGEDEIKDLMPGKYITDIAHILEEKFLIDKNETGFMIRNTAKHCIYHRMIENSVHAVKNKNIQELDKYLLYEACGENNLRRIQENEIIKPVLMQLETQLDVLEALKEMIQIARTQKKHKYRYAIANILNLIICAGGCLKGMDLSGLEIGQVDFGKINMENVDLRGANLKQANFIEPLDLVTSCSFHPSGKYFVTGGVDGKLIFWDSVTRQKIDHIPAHNDTIWKIAFSKNKKYMASCGNDSTLKVWNIERIGVERQAKRCSYSMSLKGPEAWLTCLDWYDKVIVAAGGEGKIYCCAPDEQRYWEGYTGQEGTYHCLRFSPDGKMLLAGDNHGYIQILCFDEEYCHLREIKKWKAHEGQIAAITFMNQEGTRFITGGNDGRLIQWENKQDGPEVIWNISAHGGMVTGAVLAEDGKWIVTCGHDGMIHKWTCDGQPVEDDNLKGHSGMIHAISGHGRKLLTCSADVSIRVWDVYNGPLASIQGSSVWINSLVLFGEERYLAAGCADASVQIWDIKEHKLIETFKEHHVEVITAAVSPDNRLLATGSKDGTVVFWDLNKRNIIERVKDAHAGAVRGITFLTGTYRMVSVSYDETAAYWELEWKDEDHIIYKEPAILSSQFTAWLGAVDTNLEQGLLAYTLRTGYIQISSFDEQGIYNMKELEMKGLRFQTVAFSPDGKWFSAAGDDGCIYLWDIHHQWSRQDIPVSRAHIGSICFSPDSSLLAAVGGDGELRLIHTGNISDIKKEKISKRSLHSVIFTRDGTKVIAAGADGEIRPCTIEKDGEMVLALKQESPLNRQFNYSGMKIKEKDLPPIREASLKALGASVERIK